MGDEEFIKRYPRTIKDSMRREDDKRKKKRKEIEDRKKHEKEMKKEEIKMLKNMKKKEIMDKLEKLKQITGNDDMDLDEDDIEGDFDPEKYDKKMAEIFQNYDDNLEIDDEKPTFSDLEDEEEDNNYGEDFEDWDNWSGNKAGPSSNNDTNDEYYEEPHCEDDDFNMDCDYQQEIIESTKRKKGRRKSKFAQALENTSKPVFNPTDKTFSEYVDEYYKLDCEDLIGDMPCRFQYRSVQANDFGLSVEEVLTAEDKELNAWASLRKTCQYRNEDDERKDFHVYKNKSKDANLKKKLMPSLFDVAEPEVKKEIEDDNEDKPTNNDNVETVIVGKKRKRKNKKKSSNSVSNGNAESSEPSSKKIKVTEDKNTSSNSHSNESKSDQINGGDNPNKKRKKKRKVKANSNQQKAVIQVDKISAAYSKNKQQNRNKNKTDTINSKDVSSLSNDRLKAYGVNPNQLKRKLKSEKFKKMQT